MTEPANKIDRDALHRVLWRRTTRRRTLKVHQGMFSEELGVNMNHLSRILAEMEGDGRIRKVSTDRYNVATYQITDPADYANNA